MERHEALATAAKINATYRRTLDPKVEMQLRIALYDLLFSMMGKVPEEWVHKDLDNVEIAAKAIGSVFRIGITMERDGLFWDLNAYAK